MAKTSVFLAMEWMFAQSTGDCGKEAKEQKRTMERKKGNAPRSACAAWEPDKGMLWFTSDIYLLFYQLFKQMIFLELLCSGVMKAGSLKDHSFSHFQAHSALEDNFHISFKWTSMESWSCVSVSVEMVWKTHITASATSAPSYLHGENLCKDDWPSWMPPSQTRFSSSFKSQLLRRLEASFPTLGD